MATLSIYIEGGDSLRYAYDLVVNGISLSTYGYKVAWLDGKIEDGKGTSETNILSRNNLTSDARYLGSNEKELLKFKCSLAKIVDGQVEYLSAQDRNEIDFILTSKYGWNKVEFVQDDMSGMYYNARFNNITYKNSGNSVVALEFDIECDSPYAHKADTVQTFTTSTFSVNNTTHGDRWTFPTIKLTVATTSSVSIKNITDKNRTFTIDGCIAGEVITVDCKSGLILSSTQLNRVEQCNLKYPRLAYGINNFETVNISNVEFTYGIDVRIG